MFFFLDLSTGPTSLIGLLTEGIIGDLRAPDSPYTASQYASAIAFMIGVYGLIFGFLKLGFLLEFVSIPIITGFISAVAITIMLNQMGSLLGTDVSSSAKAYEQIRQVFEFLPQASGLTCAIGFTTILFLTILDQSGKRWGDKYKVLWLLTITRAFLALVIFTSISYAVNHNLSSDDYLFNVVKVKSDGQEAPTVPPMDLVGKVAMSSLTVFIGAAIEHTAIGRAFGVKNDYQPDQSQELCYFGVINVVNSFFHSMGVGGAMSRTSVNSSCKVKSPLTGFVTTAIILICIYFLVGTLYWIPKATLAGIIICAVWPLIVSLTHNPLIHYSLLFIPLAAPNFVRLYTLTSIFSAKLVPSLNILPFLEDFARRLHHLHAGLLAHPLLLHRVRHLHPHHLQHCLQRPPPDLRLRHLLLRPGSLRARLIPRCRQGPALQQRVRLHAPRRPRLPLQRVLLLPQLAPLDQPHRRIHQDTPRPHLQWLARLRKGAQLVCRGPEARGAPAPGCWCYRSRCAPAYRYGGAGFWQGEPHRRHCCLASWHIGG